MKDDLQVTVASLISLVLLAFHLTDDILRARPGTPEAGSSNLVGVAILAVLLCGTLLFAGRRLGFVSTLLAGLFAAAMPVVHWWGKAEIVGPRLAESGRAYSFVWILMMLGAVGAFSFIASARGLWRLRRGPRQRAVS